MLSLVSEKQNLNEHIKFNTTLLLNKLIRATFLSLSKESGCLIRGKGVLRILSNYWSNRPLFLSDSTQIVSTQRGVDLSVWGVREKSTSLHCFQSTPLIPLFFFSPVLFVQSVTWVSRVTASVGKEKEREQLMVLLVLAFSALGENYQSRSQISYKLHTNLIVFSIFLLLISDKANTLDIFDTVYSTICF